jgi:hypothetical protein
MLPIQHMRLVRQPEKEKGEREKKTSPNGGFQIFFDD